MTKNTTADTLRYKEVDKAINTLTKAQLTAIAQFDATLPRDHIAFTDARDIAGMLVGLKRVAYVSNNRISSTLLKRMKLYRVVTSSVAEVYSLDKAAALEFKTAVKNTFSNLTIAMPGHKIQGTLLGYPKTSTTYFMKRWGNINQYPNVVPRSSEGTLSGEFFQDFIFSPNHYASEIRDYSEPLEYATALLLPKTYKRMRRMWRKYQFQRAVKRLMGRKEPRPPMPELFVD